MSFRDAMLLLICVTIIIVCLIVLKNPKVTPRRYFPAMEEPGDRDDPRWLMQVRLGAMLSILGCLFFGWLVVKS